MNRVGYMGQHKPSCRWPRAVEEYAHGVYWPSERLWCDCGLAQRIRALEADSNETLGLVNRKEGWHW